MTVRPKVLCSLYAAKTREIVSHDDESQIVDILGNMQKVDCITHPMPMLPVCIWMKAYRLTSQNISILASKIVCE